MSKGYFRLGGLFNKMVKELYEMLYQNDSEYIFDSSKFEDVFNMKSTSYEQGVKETVRSYQSWYFYVS